MWSWQCLVVGLTCIVSTLSRPQHYYRNVDYEAPKTAYIRHLEEAVESAVRRRSAVEALQLEDRLEDTILQQAEDSVVQDSGDPVRAARDLETLQQEWRRDKRAVDFLSGLLGSSSGGGGHAGGGAGGSDSGSILNLVGPLLGSSSGGGGGGGDGHEGGAAAGGSDSGSILNLVGPLLGSSSGGGGGGAGGEGGDAGSGSGSILSLLGPLLGSSSGGGGTGDDHSGGGGSDLSAILGISNSSGGGAGTGDGHAGGAGAGLAGGVNEVKVGFLQDKIQLLLRAKFGIFTKLLNTLSGALAAASSPQHVPIHELKYPDH